MITEKQKWEYMTINLNMIAWGDTCNKYAGEGWRVHSVIPIPLTAGMPDRVTILFERDNDGIR